MSQFRLNRREVIRGAGSIAIALPWLEIMSAPKRASAQASRPANRFLTVFSPGGCQQTIQKALNPQQRYWPTGTEASFTLSPILAPLAPMQSKIVFVRGLNMACGSGTHDSGTVGLFTGSEQPKLPGGGTGYSYLPSIDQVIATKISKGKKPKASLQMAVRWATGLTNGRTHPQNTVCYQDGAAASPVPPAIDPVTVYKDLFGSLNVAPTQAGRPDPVLARKKSILDFCDKKYVSLMNRVGAADKMKLNAHLEKLREVEKGVTSVGALPVASAKCRAPAKVDTAAYNPNEGLFAEEDNRGLRSGTDMMIPLVGKYMMDMMVMAFACDITAVGLMQWTDGEAQHSLPFINLKEVHHYYQHEGGFRPPELEQIGIWYSQQHNYLLQEMAKVDMGGHSLLDESVVLFGSEIGWPESHSQDNIPMMVAGGGGGLRGGRYLDFRKNKANDSDPGIPHNNLLVAVLNLFGDARTTYQQAGKNYCNNPIANLT